MDVEELYRKYGPMVLRRCRSLLKREDLALDALQDVIVQVLRNQNRLQDRGLSSLLYTIATNVCLNVLRRERRETTGPDEEILLTIAWAEDHAEKTVARGVTDQFFTGDLASSRTLAVYYFVDGMTLEETAQAVGLSVSGVRKRLDKIKNRGKALREVV